MGLAGVAAGLVAGIPAVVLTFGIVAAMAALFFIFIINSRVRHTGCYHTRWLIMHHNPGHSKQKI
jgi:hypothetical protein